MRGRSLCCGIGRRARGRRFRRGRRPASKFTTAHVATAASAVPARAKPSGTLSELSKQKGDKRMRETPQQYTQRVTGYGEGKQPLAVQAATAKKLKRVIKGVSTAKFKKRAAPAK